MVSWLSLENELTWQGTGDVWLLLDRQVPDILTSESHPALAKVTQEAGYCVLILSTQVPVREQA